MSCEWNGDISGLLGSGLSIKLNDGYYFGYIWFALHPVVLGKTIAVDHIDYILGRAVSGVWQKTDDVPHSEYISGLSVSCVCPKTNAFPHLDYISSRLVSGVCPETNYAF